MSQPSGAQTRLSLGNGVTESEVLFELEGTLVQPPCNAWGHQQLHQVLGAHPA